MVFEKLQEIISLQLEIDKDSLTPETKIIEDLGADSLDVVDMLMSVEDEFNVEIPDEKMEEFKTIGDVVDYIQDKID